MPHFSSGSSASAAGTTSELIRLWRSRLKASPVKHHDNNPPPLPPPPPLPLLPLVEGVLSQQQSKMSEAQDSSALERRQSSDAGITRQRSEIADERDNNNCDRRDAAPSTPKSDHEKAELPAAVAATLASAQQQHQQPRPTTVAGECNLLPVLVERLRSALELSCSPASCSEDNNSSSNQQLPSCLEDSGVDSEEDLRLWTSLNEHKPKLDLKFLEDILLADIHTALARLQDTLRRVDVNTLTRYNASLDSSNKLYLLRLISNLLAKLKVPEEALVKPAPAAANSELTDSAVKFANFRRRKNDRHTIGVSADELARARLWLDDSSCDDSSPKPRPAAILENKSLDSSSSERIVEGAPSTGEQETKTTFSDKCMKDAINQQQSKKDSVSRRFDQLLCKDDIGLSENREQRRASVFCPRQQHNKFTAKKSKIKRANTIDIPNYLQLKSDSPEQIRNGCYALRRPIDVSDRRPVDGTVARKVVPLFEPKTDNDRKFLALINKNATDPNASNASTVGGGGGGVGGAPFKSFSYRNPASVADKNWQNRFSSIKTNFDRQQNDSDSDATTTTVAKRKTGIVDVRKKFETPEDSTDGGGMRVPYGPAKQKQSSFTHAPTSPFQKIEKPRMESLPQPQSFPKPGYAPKTSALQAKLKMFDQEAKNKPLPPLVSEPPTKKIGAAQLQQQQQQPVENGHLSSYYSFCKQFAPFASGSSVDATKSKLLTNLAKEPDKTSTRKDKPTTRNSFAPKQQDNDDNRYDFAKQYSYHKPYDAYADNYRQLDKKPQFNNNSRGSLKQDKRFENVAVQTTNSERRTSQPELVDYPVPMPRKQRASVSVQTTTTSAPPIYSQPAKSPCFVASPIPETSPSVVSPIPYPQPTYKPTYHYNPSYLSDQNYYTTDNGNYPSYQSYAPPDQPQPSSFVRPTLNDTHLPISQKLYNEFSKLPDPPAQPSRDYVVDYDKTDAIPFASPYEDKVDDDDAGVAFKPIVVNAYEDKPPVVDAAEEHIENQELSSDGIVTRYTSAIATVSSMPPAESPDSPESYGPVVPRIKEAQPRHFAETTSLLTEPPRRTTTPVDEIQRHNMLQQSLIRRMQNDQQQQQHDRIPTTRRFSQEIPARRENHRSPPVSPTQIGRVCALKALNEGHKAQEKIHMFEEKRLSGKQQQQQLFRPVNVPAKLNPPPTIIQNERSPIRSPIDSSDEYLMSCASKPTRNIVLSKSESWHQLALASKGGLQIPTSTQQKPPKPKSPMRFTKQFEASAANDNLRKMEEKVQKYFQSGGGGSHEETKQTKSKSRRNLQSKKSMNSLARSHTMPHLYDDRLFDDSVDVDQAFDSIFKEATRSDNRL